MPLSMRTFTRWGETFEAIDHPHTDSIDLDRIHRLSNDMTLLTLAEVGELLGRPLRQLLWRWQRNMIRYVEGRYQLWPPPAAFTREKYLGETHERTPTTMELPPHAAVLPRPATDHPKWRAGDIYKWGWRTGRINFDGTPAEPLNLDTSAYLRRVLPRKVSHRPNG